MNSLVISLDMDNIMVTRILSLANLLYLLPFMIADFVFVFRKI